MLGAYLWLSAAVSFAQSDSINQVDIHGKRTGFWVITGEMRPEKGYCDSCIVAKGTYIDGLKNGKWTIYYKNSEQVRIIGHYQNNRPNGPYEKFSETGCLIKKGNFNHFSARDSLWFFNKDSCYLEKLIVFDNNGQLSNTLLFYSDSCLRQHLNHESKYQDSITIKYYNESNCGMLDSIAKRYVGPQRTKCNWGGTEDSRPVLKYEGDCDYFEILDTLKDGQHKIFDERGRTIIDAEIEDGWIKKGKMWCYDERGDALEYNYKNKSIKSFKHLSKKREAKHEIHLDGSKGQKKDGTKFNPNGYNKLYNEDDELWMDGQFLNGHLYNGQYYEYDSDGILLKVSVFKNGKYDKAGSL